MHSARIIGEELDGPESLLWGQYGHSIGEGLLPRDHPLMLGPVRLAAAMRVLVLLVANHDV
jgi:hypothetical protein